MSLVQLADNLYEAVNEGNVDTVIELLKKGANVNFLPSCGRTVLGRAAQLGQVAVVCLLLDADKFYTTPEEEELDADAFFTPSTVLQTNFKPFLKRSHHSSNYLRAPRSSNIHVHNCCSPSIDSETFTCSDELWGHDTSDTNVGHQSDLEAGTSLSAVQESTQTPSDSAEAAQQGRLLCQDGLQRGPTSIEPSQWNPSCSENSTNAPSCKEGAQRVPICNGLQRSSSCKEEAVQTELDPSHGNSAYAGIQSFSSSQYMPSQFKGGNIGYYVYEYREEVDTGDSSGPVVSSTEDSDSAIFEQKLVPPPLHRHSSILLHRTLGRGRANIVSSDSEFETENYRRRRHAKHNHRSHRHDREHVRHKVLPSPSHPTNPFFANLHSEYISLGLSSPWALQRSCDINQHDAYGRSALHYATEQEHSYIVHMLIRAGVKVDTPDAEHMTALHLAAQRGYAEIVNFLLDAGAKVNNKMNDKSSPLHIAASRGYTDIVEILLDRGAKIDSLDNSDRTPLFLSVSRAHHKVVQLLIKRGAKVNIEEIHGYTPLCEAVWQKDVRLAQLLLKARAKVTQSHYLLHYVVLHRHYQLADLLLGARSIVNFRDDKGDTPLIIASRSCQPSVIKLLLKHGANANYANGVTGAKPLHEAVNGTRDAQYDDFLVVFNLLKAHGAKLDVQTLTSGDTPLYRALMLEKNKAAALLIRHGCNVNIEPPAGSKDYLEMATLRGNVAIATLIVLAGFKLNRCKWLSGTYSPGTLLATLAAVRLNPLKLSDQCRIFIRKRLGEEVSETMAESSLPMRTVRFLRLEDVPEVDI